jgi:aminoglycoside phosphotransferase (APT) family kinase protein
VPVPEQRDQAETRLVLARWLEEHLPGVSDATISQISTPSLSGFSGETLLFDATWRESGHHREEGLVVRVAPMAYQIFLEPRFREQHRVVEILATETDVRVPPVWAYEPDPGPLGAPFSVLGKVAGDVPSDMPPYHVEPGWLEPLSPAARESMWWSAIDALASVHGLDPTTLGLGFLDQPAFGRTGVDQHLGYYEAMLDWSDPGPLPVVESALSWLRGHQPEDPPEGPRLIWGDARMGNLIFRDCAVQAVLDWEMVTLGPPEVDLAWFLWMDRHHSEGCGVPRLEGFPAQDPTVARYESLLGRSVRDLEWYSVFAGFRFAVIMVRVAQMFQAFGLLPPDSDLAANNTASQLLATHLGLPAPGPAPAAV